ncbi:thrombospondin type 3 repeat-containing protein [bacterium]|nr:thrombospondin type 3 repeat-containing protein [bacterium]
MKSILHLLLFMFLFSVFSLFATDVPQKMLSVNSIPYSSPSAPECQFNVDSLSNECRAFCMMNENSGEPYLDGESVARFSYSMPICPQPTYGNGVEVNSFISCEDRMKFWCAPSGCSSNTYDDFRIFFTPKDYEAGESLSTSSFAQHVINMSKFVGRVEGINGSCSGILIAKDLFLTVAHCYDVNHLENNKGVRLNYRNEGAERNPCENHSNIDDNDSMFFPVDHSGTEISNVLYNGSYVTLTGVAEYGWLNVAGANHLITGKTILNRRNPDFVIIKLQRSDTNKLPGEFVADLFGVSEQVLSYPQLSAKGLFPHDEIAVIGHPAGWPMKAQTGVVYGASTTAEHVAHYPSTSDCDMQRNALLSSSEIVEFFNDLPIIAGNSGSPVINEDGEIAGLIHWSDTLNNNLYFTAAQRYRDCFFSSATYKIGSDEKDRTLSHGYNWITPVASISQHSEIVRESLRKTTSDSDGDGILNSADNCPNIANPHQFDSDEDGVGDICDACVFKRDISQLNLDDDGDGVDNRCDVCRTVYNPNQTDSDGDGVGDACDACILDASIQHFLSDSDGDSIDDRCDNCPVVPNVAQSDSDGDGIGNLCDCCPNHKNSNQLDSDGDGVCDECDNCSAIRNSPMQANIYNELISSFKLIDGEYEGGAAFHKMGNYNLRWNYPRVQSKFLWQPDHDLDGIGDACDYHTQGGDGFANSYLTNVKSEPQPLKRTDFFPLPRRHHYDKYVTINTKLPKYSGFETESCDSLTVHYKEDEFPVASCQAAVHYCAIDYRKTIEFDWWGKPGYCTTSNKTGGAIANFHFGYSHGSDDFSKESIESWNHRITVVDSVGQIGVDNGADKPVVATTGGEKAIWNWRADWYRESNCYIDLNQTICQSIKNGGDHNEEFTMYYALSTSVLPVVENRPLSEIPSYSINEGEDIVVNNAYFPSTNSNKYARSARYNRGYNTLNYHTKTVNTQPFQLPDKLGLLEIPLCNSCYYDIPLRLLIGEDNTPLSEAQNHIGRWTIENRFGEYLFGAQRISPPRRDRRMVLFTDATPTKMIAVAVEDGDQAASEYTLILNSSESGVDWNRVGTIAGWHEGIKTIKTVTTTPEGIFFIAEENDSDHLFLLSADNPPTGALDIHNIPKIVYTLSERGSVDLSFDKIKLISVGEKLFLIGMDDTGAIQTFKKGDGNQLFEAVGDEAPSSREIANFGQSGNYIFLVGGMDANSGAMNDIWRFDTEAEIWEQLSVTLEGDFRKVIIQEVDGKLVAANPVMDGNTTHPAFVFDPTIQNVSDIVIEYIEIPVTETHYGAMSSYCIVDSENSVLPGSYQNGVCEPLEFYNYHTVSYFDYKFTLAGKENRLFIGGLTGIRTAEIEEDGSLENDHFKWIGHSVNNIQILGEKLYTASSDKIRIYKIDDGKLTRIGSIGADNPRNIRISNGKLFVADGRQVSIWNISGDSPVLEREIETSYKVKDLEIVDEKLFLYEEETYWQWFWLRKRTKFEILNLGTEAGDETVVYTNGVSCEDSEMMKDDNFVYLGCQNNNYRINFEASFVGEAIEGEKRYFRDSYLYENKVYQSFNGVIHVSK